jgi:hypothetical protein
MKYIFFTLTFILNFSCIDDSTGLCPYLEFNKEAKTWFTQISEGQNIKFTNKKGEEKNYKVIKITLKKELLESNNNWLFRGTTEYYYYDRKFITFQKVNLEGKETLQTNTFGLSITMGPPSKVPKSKVGLFTTGVPYVEGTILGYNSNWMDYSYFKDKSKIEKVDTNLKLYTEVVKFKSNSDITTFRNIIMPGLNLKLPNIINEVWIDKKYGFIYFKEIDGVEWTRVK